MWRWPATSNRISAKNVRSRSSVMTMHSTVAPSSSRMSRMRSWVIGRGRVDPLLGEGDGLGLGRADVDRQGPIGT